jgi:hypothetical protein
VLRHYGDAPGACEGSSQYEGRLCVAVRCSSAECLRGDCSGRCSECLQEDCRVIKLKHHTLTLFISQRAVVNWQRLLSPTGKIMRVQPASEAGAPSYEATSAFNLATDSCSPAALVLAEASTEEAGTQRTHLI